MNFDQIDDVLTANWLIHQETAFKYLPLLLAFANGQDISAMTQTNEARHKPYVVRGAINLVERWDISDPNIPENSIAIIPVQGVLFKYGYSGTMQIMTRIVEAINNPRICAILLFVESPGGMVANIDLASSLIKTSPKPIYSFVSRLAASAAMWLISSTKIIASSKLDQLGSIGTKVTWMDFDGIFEKLGAKKYEEYATKSIRKEHESRELIKGNSAPLKARLDFVNEAFHSEIRQNLGIKQDSEVFEGDVYFAEEAINLGLCHHLLSIEETIEMLHKEGLKKAIKSMYNN